MIYLYAPFYTCHPKCLFSTELPEAGLKHTELESRLECLCTVVAQGGEMLGLWGSPEGIIHAGLTVQHQGESAGVTAWEQEQVSCSLSWAGRGLLKGTSCPQWLSRWEGIQS